MEHKILVCGLPASGKTTYLAALWHSIRSIDIFTKLILKKNPAPATLAYLAEIEKKWVRCQQVDRTKVTQLQSITLELQAPSDQDIELNIPDMSGETWESLWVNRTYSSKLNEWLDGLNGILLFIHPDSIVHPVKINHHNRLAQLVNDKPISNPIQWQANLSPTQVMLTDLLQILASSNNDSQKINVCVIISAWDKAAQHQLNPAAFLKAKLPLLDQFINCSDYFQKIQVIGVSATGGDLDDEAVKDSLSKKSNPSERIIVVDGKKTSHDLSLSILGISI